MTQVGGALLVAAALAAVIALEVSSPPADDVARSQTHHCGDGSADIISNRRPHK